jgi:hypothetical protein
MFTPSFIPRRKHFSFEARRGEQRVFTPGSQLGYNVGQMSPLEGKITTGL